MLTGRPLIDDIQVCRLPEGNAAFWWLGQHGFAVKLGEAVCYLDAFLTPLADRRVTPLLKPSEVTNAALVLGSHDHVDHIDREAWPGIAAASPEAWFVVPALVREKIVAEVGLPAERVVGLDAGQAVEFRGISVTGVPAAHEFLDADPVTGQYPYLGFIVEGNGFRLYHAGDTCLYEGIHAQLRRGPLDLAFLPINGRDARRLRANFIGNMTYHEAADLAGSLQPGTTVATHFEMFAMNSEDPQLFADYMDVKYPDLKVLVPRHGERTFISRLR